MASSPSLGAGAADEDERLALLQAELADELAANFDKVIRIGDTAQVGRIANAVETAFAAAYHLQ